MQSLTNAKTSPAVELITATIPTAVRVSGLPRSRIYRLLRNGDLEAVKCGSATLIVMESLRGLLANLPKATFRPEPGAGTPQRNTSEHQLTAA